jgi:hypothetical protein
MKIKNNTFLFSNGLCGFWQQDGNGSPVAEKAFNLYLAVMGLNDIVDNSQSKSCS